MHIFCLTGFGSEGWALTLHLVDGLPLKVVLDLNAAWSQRGKATGCPVLCRLTGLWQWFTVLYRWCWTPVLLAAVCALPVLWAAQAMLCAVQPASVAQPRWRWTPVEAIAASSAKAAPCLAGCSLAAEGGGAGGEGTVTDTFPDTLCPAGIQLLAPVEVALGPQLKPLVLVTMFCSLRRFPAQASVTGTVWASNLFTRSSMLKVVGFSTRPPTVSWWVSHASRGTAPWFLQRGACCPMRLTCSHKHPIQQPLVEAAPSHLHNAGP